MELNASQRHPLAPANGVHTHVSFKGLLNPQLAVVPKGLKPQTLLGAVCPLVSITYQEMANPPVI